MLFNSIEFIIFFTIVTSLYFFLEHRYRWFMLLIASCIFYMWFVPVYILILFLTIVVDYYAGIKIEDSVGKKRKYYLIFSILSTCLILFVFKYFNFFNDTFQSIAQVFHWNYPVNNMSILLPIGLSFHTFQSLSYVVEVYRGNQTVERNFGIYSLYVMFYPQLVAGPIERPQNLLWQFYEEHHFEYNRVVNGLKLMAWGLFKKVVIADRLSEFVNIVYNDPTSYEGISLVIATIFFAFQIYCDFSGYSDIAIGAAQVMGFKLMTNFNRPYFSKTISEFWKRWHISLSTWFKDYLYIPLGGNKVPKWRWQFNLFITFLVSGLWHGASWNFVIWGALNGFYLVVALNTLKVRNKLAKLIGITSFPQLNKWLNIGSTFLLINFAWIFFRANTFDDSLYIVKHLFSGWQNVRFRNILLGQPLSEFIIAILVIIGMEVVHLLQRRESVRAFVTKRPVWVRWSFYYLIILGILFLGKFDNAEFIYFQF
ncbi:MBOAT family O-acyltransferase [Cytophagaceae bacterium DM2B3-1]|uniref:MBOAT family O-acyltransferase n=1 Tax=Xanthocytophaga flava TaxID=3048013 RepID=A0ABT7CS17_9BACT|nr:MBOAT family O-acyltransferase [Xanthocytophaga flavus]MDJ1496545.1 MBOAT family O-acyltransferase [Xanthocytophaga flavus]